MYQKSIVAVGLTLYFVAITGCGTSLTDSTVTGVVTIDGGPAPEGVTIMFQPVKPGGSPSYGKTDSQGRYELQYNASVKGANSGENVVSFGVEYMEDEEGVPFLPEPLKGVKIPAELQENSSLRKNVEPGRNEINLEISTGN